MGGGREELKEGVRPCFVLLELHKGDKVVVPGVGWDLASPGPGLWEEGTLSRICTEK